MSQENQLASDQLWSAWQNRVLIDDLSKQIRPQTRTEGYAIQALLERQTSSGLAGWKIAATSIAGQKHIDVGGPLAGRIFQERVHDDGASVSLVGNQMLVAETEFVFVLGSAIAPRPAPYSESEAMSCVADLRLGIEIPNSRFASFVSAGEAQLIADNACAHEFILGPVAPPSWRQADLSKHEVEATVQSSRRSYVRRGVGANVLGNPRSAFVWLVNELSQLGIPMRQGTFVTTGTCMIPLEVEVGDAVVADFGEFGKVQCEFTA